MKAKFSAQDLLQWWKGLEAKSALLICLIVSLAPFWRGLFFQADQLVFSVPVFVIGVIWFWRMRRNPQLDKLDIAVLLLSGLYLLSNVVAQNRYQALCWGLQMSAMAIIYFILSRELTDKPSLLKYLLQFMVFMSSMVALDGLLAYTGLVWGLTDAVLGGRLTATFQYPNTAAAFFNAGMILCLLAVEFCEKRWQQAVYSGLYVIQVIAFFLCRSRIAFMQLAVILLGFFLLVPWKSKVRVLLIGGANTIIGMFATNRLQDFFRMASEAGEIWHQGLGLGIRMNWSDISRQGLAWSLAAFFGGALLSFLLLPLVDRLAERKPTRQRQRHFTYAVLGTTIVVGLLIVSSLFVPAISQAMQAVLRPFLPADLVNAITNISSDDGNFTGRIMFIQNAIKIGWDYPLLGTGGGGYASVYSRYQPVFATSRFTHSQPFQVLSETGVTGFLAYIALWVCGSWLALKVLWQSFHAEEDDPRHLMLAGLLPAVWAIGAHSTFDFDLTYIAMQMWVYALLAFIAATAWTGEKRLSTHSAASATSSGGKRRGDSAPLTAYIIPIFICVLLMANVPMLVSERIVESLTGQNEYQVIFDGYERAINWVGFNSNMLTRYAEKRLERLTRTDNQEQQREDLIRALQLTAEAEKNDPLNPDTLYRRQLALYYAGDMDNAIPGAEALLQASPYWAGGVNLAAATYNRAFFTLTDNGEFARLRETAKIAAEWHYLINDPQHGHSFSSDGSANIYLSIAMANVILKNDALAQEYINLAVSNADTLTLAAQLQAALYQRQGNAAAANELLDHEALVGSRESSSYQAMLKWR